MRILTPSAASATASPAAQPALVLDLDCGAGGTHRFADRDLPAPLNAAGILLDASPLDLALTDARGAEGAVRLTLTDKDGTLKSLLEDGHLEGAEATLYQHFAGLGESDLVPLLAARVAEGAAWQEDARAVRLTLDAASALCADRVVGTFAAREAFPKVGKDEEGRMLPRLYGRVQRVRAVLARGGAETELVLPVTATDTTLRVKDASRFPEGESVRLRIHQEEIEGVFEGNTFTATSRGAPVVSGETSEATGKPFLIRASGLPATDDNAYAGLHVQIEAAGRVQTRRIVQYVAATGVLMLNQPFYSATATDLLLPAGVEFDIVTLPAPHTAGERVEEVLDEYVYVVSDAPVEAILAVEGWGVIEPEVTVEGKTLAAERRGYVPVPSTYYAAAADDETAFPDLGRAVAVIRMPRLPADIPERRFLENDLYVTALGLPGDDGATLENPADLIRHALEDLAGVESSRIDDASFAAARTARAEVKMGFALTEPARAVALALDMAFQARCALLWEGGKATLRALDNALDTSAATLNADTVEMNSAALAHTPLDEVVTEITARYTHRAERAAVTVRDETAEAAFGRRPRELSFWAFGQRHQVLAAAEWWLRRWRHRYRLAEVNTFLPGLPLERDDTVTIDHDTLSATPVAGRVVAVEHAAGRLAEREIDRIRLRVRLPLWGGCSTSCEHACETSACESASCELSCTAGSETGCAWTCEMTCEEACELACTVTCELSCQATCMVSCRAGTQGPWSCGSGCEAGCETGCESFACETSCESCCEANCEAAASETVSPIREVLVLNAPAAPRGAATVVECTRAGDAHCASFTAHDPFDVRPAAGTQCTVYLNFNYEWVIVPGPRDVKYVRVQSDAGSGRYAVVEQDHAGETWGEAFYAWAVDSV